MSSKRRRTDEEEACEALGGLLRQSAARAIERVRIQRQQRSGNAGGGNMGLMPLSTAAAEAIARTAKPMDLLVIRFCVHYLDCSRVASPTQFVRLAQNVVTASVERVLVPQVFARGTASLPALCESLVAEHTADDIQTAVKEINEFVEARGALGAWLADAAEIGAATDDEEGYGAASNESATDRDFRHEVLKREEEEVLPDRLLDSPTTHYEEEIAAQRDAISSNEDFALAFTLYRACEFWVRVQAFLNALSLHSARLHVFKMPPRYEKELLLLLYSATRGSSAKAGIGGSTTQSSPPAAITAEGANALSEVKGEAGSAGVKKEPQWDSEAAEDWMAPAEASEEDGVLDGADDAAASRPSRQLYKASALLADVLALSRCPEPSSLQASASPSPGGSSASRLTGGTSQILKGVNPDFYKMVYARLGVMVARDRLHRFDRASAVTPPELTVQQRNLQQQLQQQQQQMAAANALPGHMEAGLPTTYVPDDAYFDKLIHQQQDTVEEDEEVYKGEVMDYYLSHPGRFAGAAGAAAASSRPRSRNNNNSSGDGAAPLMKPHRFCKVKTGFSWTQYNRTHYDSRTNPPPRTEMWYEFTLFYPALANTKRDMRHIFRIEDAPEGPNDQYCLLVFSVGPPYADVAYRIRKKQWDTRRGGVRISFDQTGRYKLFFRFTNSNYRR